MEMKEQFTKISNEIFDNYVKPLCKHPETGEQCDADYSDATCIVEAVLHSDLVINLLYHFWQQSSDSCPLELTEAEAQEKDFANFITNLTFTT